MIRTFSSRRVHMAIQIFSPILPIVAARGSPPDRAAAPQGAWGRATDPAQRGSRFRASQGSTQTSPNRTRIPFWYNNGLSGGVPAFFFSTQCPLILGGCPSSRSTQCPLILILGGCPSSRRCLFRDRSSRLNRSDSIQRRFDRRHHSHGRSSW